MTTGIFQHETMATEFVIHIAGHSPSYARHAAASAFRELDCLESELSRYVESSDISRANGLALGESTVISDNAFECLWLAVEAFEATAGAFDAAYASKRVGSDDQRARVGFSLERATHTLVSHAEKLQLDLGAIGKGFALDRLAEHLAEWDVNAACLQCGGSTVLALDPPEGERGWPVTFHGEKIALARGALSASGLSVQGEHIIDPRRKGVAERGTRTWAWAPSAAWSDALATAFFVMSDEEIEAFCCQHPEVGGAVLTTSGQVHEWHAGQAMRAGSAREF
jgi:thiamine biosynthesis lipoprotein